MGAIRLQNVMKQFGPRVVLTEVTLELNSSHVTGLVGPNGAGKTTLFRLISRAMQPDLGSVTISKGTEIGYLPQEPEIGLTNTLHDEVAAAFDELIGLEHRMHELSEQISHAHEAPEELQELMGQYDRVNARFEAAGGYAFEQRLKEILGGVGFSESDYSLPMSVLSGGQKCRAALARLLLEDAEFLLLDEPTNHLDIDAVRWLEKFLAGHKGGAVIISHDRYLLDRVADRIVLVENAGVRSYNGNYSTFAETREVEKLTQEREYEKNRAFVEKEEAYIRKHLAGQRTRQAIGRRKRLERRSEAGEFTDNRVRDARAIKLEFDDDIHIGHEVVFAQGLAKSFGGKRLFENLDLRVNAGDRLGITGPNGTGKSTLLKILLGHVPADAGEFRLAPRLNIGYFAQDVSGLDPARSVLAEIQEVRQDYDEERIRGLLGRFLFTGEDAFKKVGMLSGGEQSRIRLIKLILQSPNVLVLDEPTNHLDIPSREVLETALADFPGTIITVSHDRYFLDQIADQLLVIRPEGHALYKGNYSFYIEQLESVAVKERQDKESEQAATRKPTKQKEAPPPKRKKSPYARYTIEQLEQMIMEREHKVGELSARFADPQVFRDAAAMSLLHEEIDLLKTELAEIESAWNERVAEMSG